MNTANHPAEKKRLDQLLVERGCFASRSRARDAVLRGTVRRNGLVATKPGAMVEKDSLLEIDDEAAAYVSRAAVKLVAALDHFDLDPYNAMCLDIGASTGGFTQVLLNRGARHVVSIDVGSGQLHPSLAGDPRVHSYENINARDISKRLFDHGCPDFVVCDVSFISLRLALLPALELAISGACGVFLVKPQFEAGRAAIGKNGIVRDEQLAEKIAREMAHWLNQQPGWSSIGVIPSPIRGGDGNREFLLAGKKFR